MNAFTDRRTTRGLLVMKRNSNTWEQRYGAGRRAIDRALLEEAERQLDRPYSIEDDIRENRRPRIWIKPCGRRKDGEGSVKRIFAAAMAVSFSLVGSAHAQHLLGEPGFDACREAVEVGETSPEYGMLKDWCEHPEELKRQLKGAADEEKAYVNEQRRRHDDDASTLAPSQMYCVTVRNGLSDGFAALKEGPGLSYRRIEKMYPGQWMAADSRTCVSGLCDRTGAWTHVMQGPDDQGGWIASRLVVEIRCP
jgi:hypothetical protein